MRHSRWTCLLVPSSYEPMLTVLPIMARNISAKKFEIVSRWYMLVVQCALVLSVSFLACPLFLLLLSHPLHLHVTTAICLSSMFFVSPSFLLLLNPVALLDLFLACCTSVYRGVGAGPAGPAAAWPIFRQKKKIITASRPVARGGSLGSDELPFQIVKIKNKVMFTSIDYIVLYDVDLSGWWTSNVHHRHVTSTIWTPFYETLPTVLASARSSSTLDLV